MLIKRSDLLADHGDFRQQGRRLSLRCLVLGAALQRAEEAGSWRLVQRFVQVWVVGSSRLYGGTALGVSRVGAGVSAGSFFFLILEDQNHHNQLSKLTNKYPKRPSNNKLYQTSSGLVLSFIISLSSSISRENCICVTFSLQGSSINPSSSDVSNV